MKKYIGKANVQELENSSPIPWILAFYAINIFEAVKIVGQTLSKEGYWSTEVLSVSLQPSEEIEPIPTDKFAYCNHFHELTDKHEIVDFGTGQFVANKEAIPLLKSLNELGLTTRTHHVDGNAGFVGILMDNVTIEVRPVHENHSHRTQYNGKMELLILWKRN